MIAFIPLGVLPHLGNKLWALKGTTHQSRFLGLTIAFIVTLAMLTLGGLLARALLGNALFAEGATSNHALPTLFIELFPTWLAALVGVGVLAAIMSTADGLVVSSSQTIANDLYRRTVAPRLKHRANRRTARPTGLIHQPDIDGGRSRNLCGHRLGVG